MKTCVALILNTFLNVAAVLPAAPLQHYVFFNRERERIVEPSFVNTPAFAGAQLKYTWRELEPRPDEYDFSAIEHDLALLTAKGKRLFIQVQDASFDPSIKPFPRYLLTDPAYHGGADPQVDANHRPNGWVSRRWDPAVRERHQRLILALGKQFDGRITGINLPETAIDLANDEKLWPKGLTVATYCDAVLTNLAVLKHAFPQSVAMQYANFMPGDLLPLERVYQRGAELKVALGGPDLLPYKPGQMANSYPLLRRFPTGIPTGIAVQDGNYAHRNPQTQQPVTIPELLNFATNYLHGDYIFWCTEEPYYSQRLIPFLKGESTEKK